MCWMDVQILLSCQKSKLAQLNKQEHRMETPPVMDKVRLILDTDIDTDCDDAGALAVLHALAVRGKVEILGVVCSVPVQDCVTCVRAINASYERFDIPVAGIDIPDWDTREQYSDYHQCRSQWKKKEPGFYNNVITRAWKDKTPSAGNIDAVDLYRRLLAAQPDGSVTICAIGTLSALAQLIESAPNEQSPLTGIELIAKKVKVLVTMAEAAFPEGKEAFNWRVDFPSAATTLNQWPTPVAVSTCGSNVHTGQRFMAVAPKDHPVRMAYEIYLQSVEGNRSSWDQLAVIYAVNGTTDLFEQKSGHRLVIDTETGKHQYLPNDGGPDNSYIVAIVDDETLSRHVEDLMIESLGS